MAPFFYAEVIGSIGGAMPQAVGARLNRGYVWRIISDIAPD
jgi:hypothetical protein